MHVSAARIEDRAETRCVLGPAERLLGPRGAQGAGLQPVKALAPWGAGTWCEPGGGEAQAGSSRAMSTRDPQAAGLWPLGPLFGAADS